MSPYSKRQKNDFRDAEAVQHPTMKVVAIKTREQLDCRRMRMSLVAHDLSVQAQGLIPVANSATPSD
jgi:hypothetical protein